MRRALVLIGLIGCLTAGAGAVGAELTGAVLGLPAGDITFGLPDGRGGWTSLAVTGEKTGSIQRKLPDYTERYVDVHGRRVVQERKGGTMDATVLFVPLPPGHYGVLRMVSTHPLGWGQTIYGAPITASDSGGVGARYAYALIEFDVLPGKITNAGSLERGRVVPLADDVASTAGRSGLPLVRKPMVITH